MTQIVPPVPIPITAAVTSTPLTAAVLSSLAREIAIGLRDLDDILAAHKISPADYESLKNNDFFTKVIDTARIEWNSAINTANRVQLEAAFTSEQLLAPIYARAVSGAEPLNHVVDFLKWLAEVGGLKKDPAKGQAGERFQITINLGADTKITYDGSKAPLSGDAALAALPLPAFDDKEDRV